MPDVDGASYKSDDGLTLSAIVSQVYKAGVFLAIGASNTSQYNPAKQERFIVYEAGFKTPQFDRNLQFYGAGFYYDYWNKQVHGREQDPVFGLLKKPLNIPKAYIWGVEGEIVAIPVRSVTLSFSGTYRNSKVISNYSTTPDGAAVYNTKGIGNFKGSVPKLNGTADLQYESPVSDNKAFAGGSVTYQGRENTTLHIATLVADGFYINHYTLADARVGLTDASGHWRVSAYGRNATTKTYTTAVSTYLDTLIRYRGKPAVYGGSLA